MNKKLEMPDDPKTVLEEVDKLPLSRRNLLKMAAATAGVGVLAGCGESGTDVEGFQAQGDDSDDFDEDASPYTQPWVVPLPIPDIKAPATPGDFAIDSSAHQYYSRFTPQKHYQIHVQERMHSFHPDLPDSPIWGFDGTFPGCTIKARYGEPIIVNIVNDLPSTNEHVGYGLPQIITHLHNFHTASESDGGPWDWYSRGESKNHHYCMARAGFSVPQTIPSKYRDADGGDVRESLTTLFYHDHRPEFTAANCYKGLIGFFLIHDDDDTGDETTGWRLPSGQYDVPLALTDRKFDSRTGEMTFDQFDTDGVLGDKLSVNGKIQPYMEVDRRKYRFRILNGGPARFYEVVLRHRGKNKKMVQITHNGNFLNRPKRKTYLEVQVAERHDVIIDFSQFNEGDVVYLSNVMEMKDGRGPRRGDRLNPDRVENQLIEFRIGNSAPDPSRIPKRFRPYPPIKMNEVVKTRRWEFERRFGMWAINGQLFDPDIDHTPERLQNPPHQVKRNTAERWILENSSGGWEHPVHIHLEEHMARKINGRKVKNSDRARVDVSRLGRGTEIEIFMRFRDFPDPDFNPSVPPGLRGRYVMHCHNMTHEDHAMMVTWAVVSEDN